MERCQRSDRGSSPLGRVRHSTVASITAFHAVDPGSIPGAGIFCRPTEGCSLAKREIGVRPSAKEALVVQR